MKDLKELLTDISKTARPEFRALREALKKGIEKGFIGRDLELREINTGAKLFKKSGEALLALSTSYRNKYLSQLQHAFYMVLLIELRYRILIKINTGLFIHGTLSHEAQRQLLSRPTLTENNIIASQADIDKFYFLQVLYAFITVPEEHINLRKYFWSEMPGKTDSLNQVYQNKISYLDSRKTNRIRWLVALSFLMGVGAMLYAFTLSTTKSNPEPSFLYPTIAPILQRENATRSSDENNSSESSMTISQLYETTYLALSIAVPVFVGLFIFSIILLSINLACINSETETFISILARDLIRQWAGRFSGADSGFLWQLSTYDPGSNDAATLVGLEERLRTIVEKPGFTLSTNPTPPPSIMAPAPS